MSIPLYVEASALLPRYPNGVGRFLCRLLMALVEETPVRLKLADRDIPLDRANLPLAADLREWADRVLALPSEPHNPARARQCAILYPNRRPPVRTYRREVCVLHDFAPLIRPHDFDDEMRRTFAASARDTRLCDAALALSESTKRDAVFLAGIDPGRVFVCPPGPSLCPQEHASAGVVKRRADLVLVVAAPEPRNNPRFVLDWLLSTAALPADMRLCWVGPWGEKPPAGERVEFPGVVSDAELSRLYREATFAVCPSLYTGFGLAVLDALVHGCPVAAGYHSALAEFDGPGVFYFDPGDAATLDAACAELLAARGELRIDRAELDRRYSWRALARAVVRLTSAGGLACAS